MRFASPVRFARVSFVEMTRLWIIVREPFAEMTSLCVSSSELLRENDKFVCK